MDAGDDDIIDGENGSNGVSSTSMSDGDIQQILRQFNTKYAKSKNAGASLFHVGKQSTIAKTGEIIRQLGITDITFDDVNDAERDKELREKRRKEKKKRIASLYGVGLTVINECKGHKIVPYNDERDYEYDKKDLKNAKKILLNCNFLLNGSEAMAKPLETASTTIFELQNLLYSEYRMRLSQRETAALIHLLHSGNNSIIEGKGLNTRINNHHFLTGLKSLTEQVRDKDRRRRRKEQFQFNDREKERVRAMSPSRDPAGFVGLDELQMGLLKLSRAAKKTWKLEQKYLSKVFNTYSCLEGSVDGIVLRDFAVTNLHVRLSLEEANAIMQHVDRLGYGFIPMDYCLRQLKILALGKHSIFSPIEDDDNSNTSSVDLYKCSDNVSVSSVNSSISDISNYSFSVHSKHDPSTVTAVKVPIPPFLLSKGKPLKDPLPAEVQRNNKLKDSTSYSGYNYYDSESRSQASQVSASLESSASSSIAAFRKMYIESVTTKAKAYVPVVSKQSSETTHENTSSTDSVSHTGINKNSAYYNLVMGKNTVKLPAASPVSKSPASVHTQEKKKVEFDIETVTSVASGATSLSPSKSPSVNASVASYASSGGSNTFRSMPTSFNLKNKSPSGGSFNILTPSDPIAISRPVTNSDQKAIKELKQKDIGSNLPSIIENVENRVREYDNKRWVHENFSRMPLDHKGSVLRYEKRWALLGSVVTAMKKAKFSITSVMDKFRHATDTQDIRVDHPLGEIGYWFPRKAIVDQLNALMLVRNAKVGNTLFSALDPRKIGFISSFELAGILNVFVKLPWSSPWASGGNSEENEDAVVSQEVAVSASTIVDVMISAAQDELDGLLPTSVIATIMTSICCSHQAEDSMVALLSVLISKLPNRVQVLHSPNISVKATSMRCISKKQIIDAIAASAALTELIEMQFKEATIAASKGLSEV